jgi:predicted DCC family thiol-disulfide oxidoreductase YuxK
LRCVVLWLISLETLDETLEKVMESVTIKVIVQSFKRYFMNFVNLVRKSFEFDYRSLALYRFLMGFIVIADVLYRLPDVTNFYTDVGLIPRGIFINEMTMPWSLSFHLANGTTYFAVAMFVIQFIFGVMLVLGLKSTWAMIGAYVMCVSVHNRNWLVNNGGDDIMRALLFLSIFLPLNRCFSIDSALRRDQDRSKNSHFSLWGLAFFFQVFAIYFVSYILKDHPIWRKDFTALFFSSRLDIFATSFGVWLRDFPSIQKLITLVTIYLESYGSLLLIFSFILGKFWWWARIFLVTLFLGLHFGIILSMNIGIFPYLCLVMWLLFLPSQFWDFLSIKMGPKMRRDLQLFYDGDCRFCEKMVYLIKEFFILKDLTIRPSQSDQSIDLEMQEKNSWVVVNHKGEHFYHFSGVLELMRHSPIFKFLTPLLSLPIFINFFNLTYKIIARNRIVLSSFTQYLEFTIEKKKIRFISLPYQFAGGFFLITLIAWNMTTIKKWHFSAPFFQDVTRWFHLYQEWNMFAPFPKMDNIWVEIPAVLGDDSEIELISGDRDIYSFKDKVFPALVPNEHWRKFYLNMSDKVDYARYYGGYLCRSWNERGIRHVPDQFLKKFEIVVYSQPNLSNGHKGGVSRKISWKHWCFDSDYQAESKKP